MIDEYGCWEAADNLQPGSYSYMSCHWSDVERGIVVPKYAGQIFFFADLGEMWVFRGYPETVPQRSMWPIYTIIAGLIILGIDVWLAWYLLSRLEWL